MESLINPDYEIGLIGATFGSLTVRGANYELGLTTLLDVPEESFTLSQHKRIWRTIRRMVQGGERLGDMELVEHFQREDNKVYEQHEKEEILNTLEKAQILQIEFFRERVLELYRRRTLIHQLSASIDFIGDLNNSINEVDENLGETFCRLNAGASPLEGVWSGEDYLEILQNNTPLLPQGDGSRLFNYGIQAVDSRIRAGKGQMHILAGRPGCYKSALGMQARNLAAIAGVPAAFLSLEMAREDLQARDLAWWLSWRSGRTVSAEDILAGRYGQNALQDLQAVPGYLNAFSWPGVAYSPIGQILTMMRYFVEVKGCKFLVLDYFQYVRPSKAPKGSENMASAYAENSVLLKKFSQDNKVCLLVLSQLNRETAKGGKPGLSDLKETGQLEQDAQSVFITYRQKDQLMGTLPKNRDGEMLDSFDLQANPQCFKLWDSPRDTGQFEAQRSFDDWAT